MDLSNKSLEELREMRNGINRKRDALKAELRPILAEMDARSAVRRAARVLARLTPAEKKELSQQLNPRTLASGEGFGKL